VIGLVARDDLLLLRTAASVVVVPDKFDRGVVGFGPGVGEKDLRQRRPSAAPGRDLDELFSKLDARRVGAVPEGMAEGKAAKLLRRCLDEPPLAETEHGAPQARSMYSFPASSKTRTPSPRVITSGPHSS
jgi:hypothetical protein